MIVPAQTFVATLEAVTQAGGTPVPAEIGAARLQPRSGGGRGGGHVAHAVPAAGPPLRADGRHAGALRSLAERTWARDRRGRLPGARGRARRPSRRRRRARRGVQLLPGQEPRSDGRRRRAHHRRREPRRDGARAPRARPAPEVPARPRGLHGPARHDPGDRARAEAAPARRLERGATCRGDASSRDALAGVGDLALPEVAPGSNRRSGTSTSCAPPIPMRSPSSCARGASRPAATTPSRCISPLRTRISATRRASFPVAERVAREGLSLPMFPGISEAQLTAVADAIGAFFSRGE